MRKWWILGVVVVATAAAYLYTAHQPKEYSASATLFVKSPSADQTLAASGIDLTDPIRATADQAALVQSLSVAISVAKKIGFGGDPRALLGAISATPSADTDFVTITAEDSSPPRAARLANAFAQAFIDVRSAALRQQTSNALQVARAQLSALPTGANSAGARSTLRTNIKQLSVAQTLPTSVAEISDAAVAPGAPFTPHPQRSAIFAFVLSLVFAIGGTFVLELFDRRIKNVDDIEETYAYPILAVVPHEEELEPRVDGRLAFARGLHEPFRSLRTSLGLIALDRPVQTIVVTSALAGEGKSTVVRNLALAYCEAGKRVAVIDGDLRKPSLARSFGVERLPGLTDVLAGEERLAGALQGVAVDVKGLDMLAQLEVVPGAQSNGHAEGVPPVERGKLVVLTSGRQPPNPSAVLGSPRFRDLVRELSERHDVVIVDSPPLLAVSDAVPLLSSADAVVVVSRLGRTTRAAGRRIVELIERSPSAQVAGVVVNDVSTARMQETGFEYYYYGPAYGALVE